MAQTTFERIEKKYRLSAKQYEALMQALNDKMVPDAYGEYTIANIYYDTKHYDLIRTSLEKPIYKEKIRMRSYGAAQKNSTVFLELKKKFDGIVYKRREVLPHMDAKHYLKHPEVGEQNSQIVKEICYAAEHYHVEPKAYIAYDRKAFAGIEDPELRVTFDTNLRFRQKDLKLDSIAYGTPLLESGEVLMEVKVPASFPLWMSRLFSELGIFPCSFSKYGAAYKEHILPQLLNNNKGVAISA